MCRRSNLIHLDAFPIPESAQLDLEWQRNTVLKTYKSSNGNSFGAQHLRGEPSSCPRPVLLMLHSALWVTGRNDVYAGWCLSPCALSSPCRSGKVLGAEQRHLAQVFWGIWSAVRKGRTVQYSFSWRALGV